MPPRSSPVTGLLGLAFAFALAGCATGSEEPSNAMFTFRWILACVVIVIAAFGVVLAGMALSEGESGVGAMLFVVALLLGLPAIPIEPGFVSPRERARRAAEAAAKDNSPPSQLARARAARPKLEAQLATLAPLRRRFDREHAAYVDTLGPLLRKIGAKTHRELLERGAEEREAADMLHRAAVLERALPILERRERELSHTIAALGQKEWELTHMMDLEAALSATELDDVRRVLAHAEALVDERGAPSEKQDVAELEAALFDRLVKRP